MVIFLYLASSTFFLSKLLTTFSSYFIFRLICYSDFAAVARTVGHLSKSAEVMKIVNNLMKAPEIAVTMQEFSKEMTKVTLCLSGNTEASFSSPCFCDRLIN